MNSGINIDRNRSDQTPEITKRFAYPWSAFICGSILR